MKHRHIYLLIPFLSLCVSCGETTIKDDGKEEITYNYKASFSEINAFYDEYYSRTTAISHYTIFETYAYVLNVITKDNGYYLRLVDAETKSIPLNHDPLALIHGEFFFNDDNDRVCIQSDKDFKTLWNEKPDYLIGTQIKIDLSDPYFSTIDDADKTIYQKDDNNKAMHIIACEII